MKRQLLIYPVLLLLACNSETKKLDFGHFTMEVPKTWNKIDRKGIDSYVGEISADNNDTISFDLGWYASDLTEETPYMVDEGNVNVADLKKSTSHELVYKYYGKADTIDLKKFLKNEYEYDTIDHKRAKIVKHKVTGNGTTGVVFDSLWVSGSGVDRLQISGYRLKELNQNKLLTAIRTIKFRK